MIRHSVHLRFAKTITGADKRALYDQLASLSGHIDGVLDFQHRTNVSPESAVVHGFEDMFWFDFSDETVRNAYLEDKVHKAIGAEIVDMVEGGTDGVFVCDVEL